MNRSLKTRALPLLAAVLAIFGAFAAGLRQHRILSATVSTHRSCNDAICLTGVQLELSAGMGFPVSGLRSRLHRFRRY